GFPVWAESGGSLQVVCRRATPGEGRSLPARLAIEGGIPLKGRVKVSAATNAALPAAAAGLLTAEPLVFPNVPDLQDVRTMSCLLETLGAMIERDGPRVAVRVARVTKDEAAY